MTVANDASDLIGTLVMANYNSMTYTMNQLYDNEVRRRMALEVWLGNFQNALDDAHGGTYREMDAVLRYYAFPPSSYEEELRYAQQHEFWKTPLSEKS